jgi:hypothetical protein
VDPAWLAGFGDLANRLGFAGLALVVISGLAWVCRTLWRAFLDSEAKGASRDALILDMETEHQRLLVRFEESMERLREMAARVRQLEAALDEERRPAPPSPRRRRA